MKRTVEPGLMGLVYVIFLLTGMLAGPPVIAAAQGVSPNIRINQVGFWPYAAKSAVIIDPPEIPFEIRNPDLSQVVYTGIMSSPNIWVSASNVEKARVADFSDFSTAGTWVLSVPGLGTSPPFEIREAVQEPLTKAVLKAFYYARASKKLEPAFGGLWSRASGHPDTDVLVHPSAADLSRPAGSSISSPRGWYDAGDYNKYVVNSGITTGSLLMLYEHFPDYFGALDLNIPESNNDLPDLLDEVLWNLRWMMTMQDPGDGGVYHKLTTPNFEGIVMPSRAVQQRYVVQKSTTASLNFAAVAAIGSRVFRAFPQTEALADSLFDAATRAWNWSQYIESDYGYDQNAVNGAFDPDIQTGEYGDNQFHDEYRWAAAELFLTTRADSFLFMYPPVTEELPSIPGWQNVGTLGLWSLAHHRDLAGAHMDTTGLKNAILNTADRLADFKRNSAYGIVFGNSSSDFVWGSNSVAANQANMLLIAYQWSSQPKYLDAAIANLDYLLGRNATGYSFVTGVGSKSPRFPHHRQSQADLEPAPVPGMLVGGPNPGQQDGCVYPSDFPAKSYTDQWCSYASNEVAINWQASISYLVGALEAIHSNSGMPQGTTVDSAPSLFPGTLRLDSWPNPASGPARIAVELTEPSPVVVTVYDVIGRVVARIFEGGRLDAGYHVGTVDAASLPAGVYVIRAQAGSASMTSTWVVVH